MLDSYMSEIEDTLDRFQEGLAKRIIKTGIFEDANVIVEDIWVSVIPSGNEVNVILTIETDSGDARLDEATYESINDILNEQFYDASEDYFTNNEFDEMAKILEVDYIGDALVFLTKLDNVTYS